MGKSYRVNIGMNYPPEKRAEIGDVVDDIPDESVPMLLANGMISELDSSGNPIDTQTAELEGTEPGEPDGEPVDEQEADKTPAPETPAPETPAPETPAPVEGTPPVSEPDPGETGQTTESPPAQEETTEPLDTPESVTESEKG